MQTRCVCVCIWNTESAEYKHFIPQKNNENHLTSKYGCARLRETIVFLGFSIPYYRKSFSQFCSHRKSIYYRYAKCKYFEHIYLPVQFFSVSFSLYFARFVWFCSFIYYHLHKCMLEKTLANFGNILRPPKKWTKKIYSCPFIDFHRIAITYTLILIIKKNRTMIQQKNQFKLYSFVSPEAETFL